MRFCVTVLSIIIRTYLARNVLPNILQTFDIGKFLAQFTPAILSTYRAMQLPLYYSSWPQIPLLHSYCWCPQGIYASQTMSDNKQMILFDHIANFISDVWILAKFAADSNERWLRVSLAIKASVDSSNLDIPAYAPWHWLPLAVIVVERSHKCICDVTTAYIVPATRMSQSQSAVSRLADAVQDWHNGSSAGLEGLKTSQGATVKDERKVFDTKYVRHGTDDPQTRSIQHPLAAVTCRVSEINGCA